MPAPSEQAARLVVVIPAYRPSAGLVDLVRNLVEQRTAAIVIVDDGSGPDFRGVFDAASAFPGVQLLRHAVNLGKGAALKTAFNHVLCAFPNLAGVVTADADGQHDPEDIRRVADELLAQPNALILGSRSFDRDVPLRSRFGNVLTRGIMHALLGQKLTDTQTGLRGIPASFLPKLLRYEATGYEFELEMLIAAHELSIPMVEAPIRTIYEAGNTSSHFNPIIDSMKVYFVLLRFGSISVLSGLLDSLVYILVWNRTQNPVAAQVVGRIVSVCFNYSMVRSSVFYSHQRHKTVLPKYLLLVVASGTASYWGIQLLRLRAGVSPIPAKLMVETTLFFVNFAVQRLFIFKPQEGANGERRTAPLIIFSALTAIVFFALLGVEIYGFTASRLFAQEIWLPEGLQRFLKYIGLFVAFAGPLLAMVPWTFAGMAAAVLLLWTAATAGIPAVLATGIFFLSACALGSMLLSRTKADTLSVHLCATLLGIGVYVFLMIFLARLPVNYPLVWGALLAVPLALDARGVWRRGANWLSLMRRAELRSGWERAAFALVIFLMTAHLLVAVKPEIGADALAMHLAVPMNIAANHVLTFQPARFLWSVMPMGCDWAYAIVYQLGGEYATRLLNFAMLAMTVLLIYRAARRWVSPAGAWLLAASFAATPVVQFVTGSLFVENFLAAVVLGLLTAIWLLGETGERKFLFAAAVLAGTAVTTKYGALLFVGLAIPFAGAEVARYWKLMGARPWATCALALLLLLVTAAPTYAIAWQKTGNPIYPFLNTKFHSPLLDPREEFIDLRYRIAVDWSSLYVLTFQTGTVYEGQNGTFGFQYLVLAPLALVGLLLAIRRPAASAAVLALGAGIGIMLSQPNVRYLYTSMAVLPVPIAALLGWLRSNQRWLYRSLLVYLAACTGLNTYFLAGSSYYQKDFYLRHPFSAAARERYIHEAAPIRVVIAWYNQHHPNSTVLLTADSLIAGLTGQIYMNNWHQYTTVEALRRASTVEDTLRLMERWHVEYFIAHKPAPGESVHPLTLQALLDRCTQPEYEAGEFYLARLDPNCHAAPDAPPIAVPAGFYDDFDPAIRFRGGWERDSAFERADHHTISYSDVPGAEISIDFEAPSLTYVFTRAPNRGIAAVTIDGAAQTLVDLYSPRIEWQSRRQFCCFGPGRHHAVIRVTGNAHPQSTGRFVDLDSFEVR